MKETLRAAIAALNHAAVWALVLAIRAYQAVLSPMLGNNCRFAPSCSKYAVEALQTHGVLKGTVLAVWRVLRCHPFSEGGYDPVPEKRR